MPTYFVIETLEDGYEWRDFIMNDLSLEYAIEVLEIPESSIESIEFIPNPNRLEITISEDYRFIQDDWYYTLVPFAS